MGRRCRLFGLTSSFHVYSDTLDIKIEQHEECGLSLAGLRCLYKSTVRKKLSCSLVANLGEFLGERPLYSVDQSSWLA